MSDYSIFRRILYRIFGFFACFLSPGDPVTAKRPSVGTMIDGGTLLGPFVIFYRATVKAEYYF
jgi:hypothetical protein